jgi:hypothetical protein
MVFVFAKICNDGKVGKFGEISEIFVKVFSKVLFILGTAFLKR